MMTIKLNLLTSVLFVIFNFFCSGMLAAHGKVDLDADVCVRNISGSMVHLSTYQRQHDPSAEYCTEIPKEGETLWVLDLVDQALRDMPVVIKIMQGADTVTSLYSNNHRDGIIKGAFNLNEGAYTLFVTGEGVPPLHYEYPIRVQLTNYKDLFFKYTPYLIAFILLALMTDKILKRRKMSIK